MIYSCLEINVVEERIVDRWDSMLNKVNTIVDSVDC